MEINKEIEGISGSLKVEYQKGSLIIMVLYDHQREPLESSDKDPVDLAQDVINAFKDEDERPFLVTDNRVVYYVDESGNDFVMYGEDPNDTVEPTKIAARFSAEQADEIITLMEEVVKAEKA